MRVLIAEDSGMLRRALARMVEGLGHDCVQAPDGEVAWAEFESDGADVVISDWIMPGIEGPELCRRIRSATDRPYTYVIFLTVLDEKHHALAGMRAGADDYLNKPVDLDELQLRLIAAERVTALHRQLAERGAEERRVSFAAGLDAAQERLRAQVAELLHGRVQTRLLLVHHRLARAEQLWQEDSSRALQQLSEARELLDHVREQDVRRASHLLHPPTLRVGLGAALAALARELESELTIELKVDEGVESLPSERRLTAYRVVEEALANVVRHAEAKHVTVEVASEGADGVQLTVCDDGRGFDPAALTPGLGLSSIAGRVVEAGGSWRIDSSPGGGATLTARLPGNWARCG
jgi:signal transduction histidine kinase